jgi:hypothetical protein
MFSRICICCGEAIALAPQALSRNPNVCASCSSLADGMGEAGRAQQVDMGKDACPAPEEADSPVALPAPREIAPTLPVFSFDSHPRQ